MTTVEPSDKLQDELRALLRAHYDGTSRPIFLAELGGRVSSRPPGQTSLRAYISDCLRTEYDIVQVGRSPQRLAVVPADQSSEARRNALDPNFAYLIDQPRALIAAFTLPVESERRAFYSMKSGRYAMCADAPPPDDSYVEIPNSSRVPFPPERFAEMPADQRAQLVGHIRAWLERATQPSAREESQPTRRTALHRLLDALPPAVRSQVVIPADIVEILLRHK